MTHVDVEVAPEPWPYTLEETRHRDHPDHCGSAFQADSIWLSEREGQCSVCQRKTRWRGYYEVEYICSEVCLFRLKLEGRL